MADDGGVSASIDTETSVTPTKDEGVDVLETLEPAAVGTAQEDAGEHLKLLDQATFFRAVDNGNLMSVSGLIKKHEVDVNAFNDDGVTALILAVCHFEKSRDISMIKLLLDNGARACVKAVSPPNTQKVRVQKRNEKPGHFPMVMETKKIDLDHKTPLLIALELKSSLYVKGWDYRHWDKVLELLSEATLKEFEKDYEATSEPADPSLISQQVISSVQDGWTTVYKSGKHEIVELWAEGHCIPVLKELVNSSSKVLKFNVEKGILTSERIDLKEASLTVANAMVEFIYTGKVEEKFMEYRGIDLFIVASKYCVKELRKLCEESITAHPDTWIKLLSAATEFDSRLLTWKCTSSIYETMAGRSAAKHFVRPIFWNAIEQGNGRSLSSDLTQVLGEVVTS